MKGGMNVEKEGALNGMREKSEPYEETKKEEKRR